jgi:adenylate kinase
MEVLKDGIEKQLRENPLEAGTLRGFILDGFPRNEEQTDGLFDLCQATGARIGKAIYLEVPFDVIVERAANRRICNDCGAIYNLTSKPPKEEGVCDACGSDKIIHRVDDHPERVQTRLQSFEKETQPIMNRFKDRHLLQSVDGHRAIPEISQEIIGIVAPFFEHAPV